MQLAARCSTLLHLLELLHVGLALVRGQVVRELGSRWAERPDRGRYAIWVQDYRLKGLYELLELDLPKADVMVLFHDPDDLDDQVFLVVLEVFPAVLVGAEVVVDGEELEQGEVDLTELGALLDAG